MKKMLFSALACVAFVSTGFAANEVVKDEKCDQIFADVGCSLQVNIVEDGQTAEVLYFTGKLNMSREGCFSWALLVMERLEAEGKKVDGFQIIRS